MNKLDPLDELLGFGANRTEIKEMAGTELREISAVDQPATGRRFVMFKRRSGRPGIKAVDFPGLGSDAPTGQSSLLDLTRFLEANPNMTPTQAEAAEAGDAGNVAALADDFGGAGNEATVSDPPTAGDFMSAKQFIDFVRRSGGKATFEECVDAVMSQPGFEPQGDRTPEESARAICATKPGGPQEGKTATRGGEPTMGTRKQDPMMEPVMGAEVPMPAAAAVEVPASPTEWPLSQCLADAADAGIENDDDAVAICQLIRGDLGKPDDPNTILVPQGASTETLIIDAGRQLGLIKPEGMGGGGGGAEGGNGDGEMALRFTGKNRWLRRLNDFLGLNRKPAVAERRLARLDKEVGEMQKANRDLLRIIQWLIQGGAQNPSAPLPTLESLEGEAGGGEGGDASALAGALGALGAAGTAGDGKAARKDGPPAIGAPGATPGAQAPAGAGLTDEERAELDRLRAENAELRAMTGTGPAAAGELEPPTEGALLGPVSAPAPAPAAPAITEPPAKILRPVRQSVAPQRKAVGGLEMVPSTILGGALIPRQDREALR